VLRRPFKAVTRVRIPLGVPRRVPCPDTARGLLDPVDNRVPVGSARVTDGPVAALDVRPAGLMPGPDADHVGCRALPAPVVVAVLLPTFCPARQFRVPLFSGNHETVAVIERIQLEKRFVAVEPGAGTKVLIEVGEPWPDHIIVDKGQG
jgi:hypothetical protein